MHDPREGTQCKQAGWESKYTHAHKTVTERTSSVTDIVFLISLPNTAATWADICWTEFIVLTLPHRLPCTADFPRRDHNTRTSSNV
jgi:hypothetical protein